MTAVSIVREPGSHDDACFRAVDLMGKAQAVGKSAGEALDALAAQLEPDEAGTLIVVRHLRPDAYFTEAQMVRLRELLARLNESAESGESLLTPAEHAELQDLIEAELHGSARRAGFW